MKVINLLISLLIFSTSQAQIITTVAGNGTYGYSGDGGLATSAQLAEQMSVVADNSGNIFIADFFNDVIRKVDAAGIITNFAGTGVFGYSGDGGAATSAQLYHPAWMGIDNANNIYVSDQNGEVIRKIDNSTGIITSITGNLPPGYSGDGGLLIAAQFRSITGISFDIAGNMYIADGNNVIRKVNSNGIISTVVGTGTPGFSGDGGPATSAQLGGPYTVVFDNTGNMYIPDNGNKRIRKVNTAGIITTYAGTGNFGYNGDGGQATSADLQYPWTIDIDNSGNLYIGDAGAYVVRKVATNGIITTYAGNGTFGNSGDGGLATMAQLGGIACVNVDAADNLLISVREYFNVIRKVNNCPTAAISRQPSDVTLCNLGNAIFTVVTSNAISHQWQLNVGSGWSNLTDNSVYSGVNTNTLSVTGASSAMNNYQYRCLITNNCGTVFSTPAFLSISTAAAPSLIITASAGNICEGVPVTFTASATNGGTAPLYQWKKNGLTVGTNNASYIDNRLTNGDIINCILTSNANCLATPNAISNSIAIPVSPNVTPGLIVSASNNNICAGTSVTFSAIATNGGLNPQYTWLKNNVDLILNSPTYTDIGLNNGDVIMCTVRSSLSCVTQQVTPGIPITMSVNPLLIPSIGITASAISFCKNNPITFTAIPKNGGNTPVFQWQRNGMPVGSNSNNYIDNNFVNRDLITCTLTSNSSCVTTSQVMSNSLAITIHPDPVVNLDKNNSICNGGTRLLDAGSFTSYSWNNGSANRAITINNTGLYSVTVTDINGCKGTDFTSISKLLPSPFGFLPSDTSVCSYESIFLKPITTFNGYLWNNSSTNSSISVSQPGKYWLQVKDVNGCFGTDSITVFSKECLKGFFMPTAFTPNNDEKNDIFKPILLGNIKQYQFLIFNRWGQIIFNSTDYKKGWNGNFKEQNQNGNVFVWMCIYQLEGETLQHKKGTVVLIR